MQALKCELCGSNDIVKDEGFFVCQYCKTKYTVEEARKMIVEGTVRIDNSGSVGNYIEMARSALEAENLKEAEDYCNKVIEIDSSRWDAWYLKGKAAGWQTTGNNNRLNEASTCFIKALELAPESEKEAQQNEIVEQIKLLATVVVAMKGNIFQTVPSESVAAGLIQDMNSTKATLESFAEKSGIDVLEVLDTLASTINSSVVAAWKNKILPEYEYWGQERTRISFNEFISRISLCELLTVKAIDLSPSDELNDIERYKNIIIYHEHAIDACSYKPTPGFIGIDWEVDYRLTAEARAARRKEIKKCETAIVKIKKSLRKKYWTIHTDEHSKYKTLKNSKTALQSEREKLGLFDAKKKKAIDNEIQSIDIQLKKLRDKAVSN
jgi:tetratricopeptide (TPR) repeat protein